MLGRTHFKLGILYYAILSTIPVIALTPITSMKPRMIFICLLTAGYAALIPDLDCTSSLAYNNNPIGTVVSHSLSITQRLVNRLVYLLMMVGSISLIYINRNYVIKFSVNVLKINNVQIATLALYVLLGIFVILALIGPRTAPAVPVIGWIYLIYEYIARSATVILKRVILGVIYVGSAIYLIYYNYNHSGIIWGYIAAALIILAVLTPHRTFLHAPEGLFLFSLVFYQLAVKLGLKQAGIAFVIGYASHLYLSDIFTNSGVPLTFLGHLMKIMPWHSKIKDIPSYNKIFEAANTKLRIPIMRTGTIGGGITETIYVMLLTTLLTVLIAIKYF